MKLINYRQTIFVTNDGYNKINFEFDTLEKGASIEILGCKAYVASYTQSLLIPEVKHPTYTNALLNIPGQPTSVIPIKLKPINRVCAEILCISENINTTMLSAHPEHCIFTDFLCFDKDFSKLATSGNIEINAINSKTHTHHLYGEALMRSLYRIREIKEHFGIQPQTAVLSGPSGISSSAVIGLINAGIKNLIILRSDYRNNRLSPDLPNFFKLYPQKHKDSLTTLIIDTENSDLTSQIANSRFEDTYLFDRISLKKLDLSIIEEKIEKAIGDTETMPFVSNTPSYAFALCDYLGSRFKNPEFKTVTPTSLMESLKSRTQGNIPKLHGEISDNKADFITAVPSVTADIKTAMFSLPIKETCSTLRTITDKEYIFPDESLKKGYEALTRFFSCDASASNEDWACELLKCKTECCENEHQINPFIKTGKSESVITVINPTPYKRSNSTNFSILQNNGYTAYNTPNSLNLKPYQFTHFVNCKSFRNKTKISNNNAPSFDIGCYSVSYNKTNGKIISITDKCDMRELIDFNNRYSLCDCIYVTTPGETSYITGLDIHTNYDYAIQESENEITLSAEGIEKQSETQIESSVTFYKNTKNIDICIKLSGSNFYNCDFYDRFKKNLVIALPIRCDNANFFTENNNIITNELTERLRFNSTDFSVVSSRAIIDNGSHGIAVITPDAPIIYYGDIRYNKFSTDYWNTSSSVFIYAESNRFNKNPEKHKRNYTELKIRLFPYSGNWQKTLMPSIDFIHPLIISNNYLTLNSKIVLSSKNILLLTFKPAENKNGFILRLFEAYGIKSESSVILPFKIARVYYDNIIEEDLFPNTTFEKNKISFTVNAFDYVTLRIIPETEA